MRQSWRQSLREELSMPKVQRAEMLELRRCGFSPRSPEWEAAMDRIRARSALELRVEDLERELAALASVRAEHAALMASKELELESARAELVSAPEVWEREVPDADQPSSPSHPAPTPPWVGLSPASDEQASHANGEDPASDGPIGEDHED